MSDYDKLDKFSEWWNSDKETESNPYREGSPAFWAWEGWMACRQDSVLFLEELAAKDKLSNYYLVAAKQIVERDIV